MIAADLVRASVVTGLIALIAGGAITIAVLLAAVALVTAISCIFDPAAQAMIPDIVGQDKSELDRFNGHFWVAYSLGQDLAGPPLGSVAFAAARTLPFVGVSSHFWRAPA